MKQTENEFLAKKRAYLRQRECTCAGTPIFSETFTMPPQNALKAYARIPVLFETPRSKDSLNQPDVADKPAFTVATVNKILSKI